MVWGGGQQRGVAVLQGAQRDIDDLIHNLAMDTHCQQSWADGDPAQLPEEPRGEAQHGFDIVGEPLDPWQRREPSQPRDPAGDVGSGTSTGTQRPVFPSQPGQEPHMGCSAWDLLTCAGSHTRVGAHGVFSMTVSYHKTRRQLWFPGAPLPGWSSQHQTPPAASPRRPLPGAASGGCRPHGGEGGDVGGQGGVVPVELT